MQKILHFIYDLSMHINAWKMKKKMCNNLSECKILHSIYHLSMHINVWKLEKKYISATIYLNANSIYYLSMHINAWKLETKMCNNLSECKFLHYIYYLSIHINVLKLQEKKYIKVLKLYIP